MQRILTYLVLFVAFAGLLPGVTLNNSTTTAVFDPVSIGREYRITTAGNWDGATLSLEVWNETLGAYSAAQIPLFSASSPSGQITATGKRLRVTVNSATALTSLAVEHLRLPLDGSGKITTGNISSALGYTPAEGAIHSAGEILPSTVLFHDDCSGDSQTLVLNGTRVVRPGPGTMTASAVPGISLVRYEKGALTLSPMPSGTGQVVLTAGAQTAVPGLTVMARIVPSWTPGKIGQARIGFTNSLTTPTPQYGQVNMTTPSPSNYALSQILIPKDATANSYLAGIGVYNPGEEVALCVHYRTLTHHEYFMQGGRAADFGCTVGSNNWWKLGETTHAISGNVYPFISNQYDGNMIVRDFKVLSSWSPSERHKTFDYDRQKLGVHIPSLVRDPVTGLVVLGWNSGTLHVGPGDCAIRYSTRLANGTFTPASTLQAAPAAPAGQSIQSLSVVGSRLWLIYWKESAGLDGGVLHRKTCTVNATTGAITLGPETALGIPGSRNLSFSPIITLKSGRLLLPYHKADASPAMNTYIAHSDNSGTTWTETRLTPSMPGGTTTLVEPTIVEESDGAVGCYIRTTAQTTYYSRCALPNAATPVWTTPAPVNAIPQPTASGVSGSRVNVIKRKDGQILVIGNDSKNYRRNLTVWRMGDNAKVIDKVRLGDWNPVTDVNAECFLQYPVLLEDGNDLLIAYSHCQPGSPDAALSAQIRLHTWRWPTTPTTPLAREAGGTGLRSTDRPLVARTPDAFIPITYSTAPAPDMEFGNRFHLTLTASTAVIGAPLNPMPWEEIELFLVQGGTGSYTATFNSIFEFNGITPTWRTAVNASNVLKARYNGLTGKWIVTSWN